METAEHRTLPAEWRNSPSSSPSLTCAAHSAWTPAPAPPEMLNATSDVSWDQLLGCRAGNGSRNAAETVARRADDPGPRHEVTSEVLVGAESGSTSDGLFSDADCDVLRRHVMQADDITDEHYIINSTLQLDSRKSSLHVA